MILFSHPVTKIQVSSGFEWKDMKNCSFISNFLRIVDSV